jgi:hypothetical protein
MAYRDPGHHAGLSEPARPAPDGFNKAGQSPVWLKVEFNWQEFKYKFRSVTHG